MSELEGGRGRRVHLLPFTPGTEAETGGVTQGPAEDEDERAGSQTADLGLGAWRPLLRPPGCWEHLLSSGAYGPRPEAARGLEVPRASNRESWELSGEVAAMEGEKA